MEMGGAYCYIHDWKASLIGSKVQKIWAFILSCRYTWNIVFFFSRKIQIQQNFKFTTNKY